MTTQTATSVRLTRMMQADPATVFRAWTEPEQLHQWSCPEGASITDVRVDLRVGGRYRIRMRGAEGQAHTAVGVYREIERPRRLVYTWDWEEADQAMGETLITVEFVARGNGTEVTLTHERFPGAEAKTSHEQGWTSCLDRLERLFPARSKT